MGNRYSQNDDFSKSANFDMNRHQQAMANLSSNYANTYTNIQSGISYRPQITETQFRAIHRSCSIYKPSISITTPQYNLMKIDFEYDSDQGNRLQILIGVRKVEQDPQNKLTLAIDSQLRFDEMLPAGKKSKFSRQFELHGFNKITGCTVILRMISLIANERTEYSVKNTGKNQWKVLLEKLEFNDQVTQLDNIYRGGGENDDCIICFTEKVSTIIEPCNHLCLCYDCAQQINKNTKSCPICRSLIKGFKKIKSDQH